jgi:hypothetical protein
MSSIRAQQPAAPAAPAQPAAARGGGSNSFLQNLGASGLLWVIAGLVICGSFFLPWFSSRLVCNDPVCSASTVGDAHFVSHYASSPTGFSIASGTFTLTTTGPSGAIHESFSFLLLWLVFLAGLLLIALPLLLAFRKMHSSRTLSFLLVLGLLLLVVEIGYAISAAQALPQTKVGLAALLNSLALRSAGRLAFFDFSTGPNIGFWLALAATLVAIGASISSLFASSLGRRFDAGLFWRNLGLAGQVMLVSGFALVVAFFLPWFSTPDPAAGPGGYQVSAAKQVTVSALSLSGWSTAANGLQTPYFASGTCTSCVAPQVSIFLSLWLIPLAGLVLIAVAWMMGRGLLWRRMAAILACVICLVALTLEVFFLLEVQSLQNYDQQLFQAAGDQLVSTAYGVVWGFWAALIITGAALLVSGFLLLQRHKSVTGKLVP